MSAAPVMSVSPLMSHKAMAVELNLARHTIAENDKTIAEMKKTHEASIQELNQQHRALTFYLMDQIDRLKEEIRELKEGSARASQLEEQLICMRWKLFYDKSLPWPCEFDEPRSEGEEEIQCM